MKTNKETFDIFYDKFAPLCYGLALTKLKSQKAAQEVFKAFVVKVAASITEADMFSEAMEKEVCKTAQQEISSYKKEWVLNDLFSCRSLLSKSA